MFREVYRTQLATRLLNGRSRSGHAERIMISKLKTEMSSEFTSSMQGMLNDLNVAADHERNFATHLENVKIELPIPEFKVRVLTTGFWPSYPNTPAKLPAIMAQC